jgi:O-antigen ligase
MNSLSFFLYLLFIGSWFIHLSARIPFLGSIRFDLLLVTAILVTLINSNKSNILAFGSERSGKVLGILFFYCILSAPFVEWPGSVLNNIPNFIKAVVFYFFTVSLINSEKRLKIFIFVFLAVQSFRVFEPLYLHLTAGYWGSFASMSDSEFMNRLAGAPFDIINPNGLAFVIITVLPFLHYLSSLSLKWKVLYFLNLPMLIYALILTGSRSGMLGLLAILAGFIIKSIKKILLIGIVSVCILVVFANLSPEQSDRYLSLVDPSAKNRVTAEGRMTGLIGEFEVALRRPFFGHGLGTSLETNWNFLGEGLLSHNLYVEIAQELGFIGLIIFLYYMGSIIQNLMSASSNLKKVTKGRSLLGSVLSATQIWLLMNIVFSFASFGLSRYAWYLLGGLCVVIQELTKKMEIIRSREIAGDTIGN